MGPRQDFLHTLYMVRAIPLWYLNAREFAKDMSWDLTIKTWYKGVKKYLSPVLSAERSQFQVWWFAIYITGQNSHMRSEKARSLHRLRIRYHFSGTSDFSRRSHRRLPESFILIVAKIMNSMFPCILDIHREIRPRSIDSRTQNVQNRIHRYS
jgi:hypothetical protein